MVKYISWLSLAFCSGSNVYPFGNSLEKFKHELFFHVLLTPPLSGSSYFQQLSCPHAKFFRLPEAAIGNRLPKQTNQPTAAHQNKPARNTQNKWRTSRPVIASWRCLPGARPHLLSSSSGNYTRQSPLVFQPRPHRSLCVAFQWRCRFSAPTFKCRDFRWNCPIILFIAHLGVNGWGRAQLVPCPVLQWPKVELITLTEWLTVLPGHQGVDWR